MPENNDTPPTSNKLNPDQPTYSNRFSFQSMFTLIKSKLQGELRLKNIIQRAQKIDFMNNIPSENKVDFKHTFYINIFLAINTAFFGIYMFTHQYYRSLKYVALYLAGITYIGVTFAIFWEDRIFINALSTKQDAYKSEIKYVLRKQCLQNATNLQRLQSRRQIFLKLNQEFQQFHTIKQDHRIVSLLP